ncbi:MAG: hypothetical protein JNL32_13085 [Candidatus Kapabacteria bacterium]|nr:hypothetical protein [Candidatus Kapabacteria bacterium]
MTSLKELIVSGKTDGISDSVTILEILRYFGISKSINNNDTLLGTITVDYDYDGFTFTKEKKIIALSSKFDDFDINEAHKYKSIYSDFIECGAMTRQEWFDFLLEHRMRWDEFRTYSDEYENFTDYFGKSMDESKEKKYSLSFSLCNNEDRILWVSMSY